MLETCMFLLGNSFRIFSVICWLNAASLSVIIWHAPLTCLALWWLSMVFLKIAQHKDFLPCSSSAFFSFLLLSKLVAQTLWFLDKAYNFSLSCILSILVCFLAYATFGQIASFDQGMLFHLFLIHFSLFFTSFMSCLFHFNWVNVCHSLLKFYRHFTLPPFTLFFNVQIIFTMHSFCLSFHSFDGRLLTVIFHNSFSLFGQLRNSQYNECAQH